MPWPTFRFPPEAMNRLFETERDTSSPGEKTLFGGRRG